AGMLRWARAFLAYPQKIPVYYLGRVYDSVHTFLPWHNTLVLTGVMVPAGLLVLAAVGLATVAWRQLKREAPSSDGVSTGGLLSDRVFGGWAAIGFLTMMVLRTLPFMPAHDGLRHLVPAFFFFPVLAACGARTLAGWFPGRLQALAPVLPLAL